MADARQRVKRHSGAPFGCRCTCRPAAGRDADFRDLRLAHAHIALAKPRQKWDKQHEPCPARGKLLAWRGREHRDRRPSVGGDTDRRLGLQRAGDRIAITVVDVVFRSGDSRVSLTDACRAGAGGASLLPLCHLRLLHVFDGLLRRVPRVAGRRISAHALFDILDRMVVTTHVGGCSPGPPATSPKKRHDEAHAP